MYGGVFPGPRRHLTPVCRDAFKEADRSLGQAYKPSVTSICMQMQVHDLQAENADLQAALHSQPAASSSTASRRQLPSDFLADFSLDLWQGNRLRAIPSHVDLEDPKHEGKSEPWLAGNRWRWLRIAAGQAQRLSKLAENQLAASGFASSLKQMVGTKGRVSGRVWLVVAYLAILHLTLMVSFTKSQPNLDVLCAPKQGLRLPGQV